jgi:hypothetical protein
MQSLCKEARKVLILEHLRAGKNMRSEERFGANTVVSPNNFGEWRNAESFLLNERQGKVSCHTPLVSMT